MAKASAVHRSWHSPFDILYESVRKKRNDAMHQGVYARHLTLHSIQASLVLEDALMKDFEKVSDYMVREPVCAYIWQPLSYIRQEMLMNSFSYIPIFYLESWQFISDTSIAKYLAKDREARVAHTVKNAVKNQEGSEPLEIDPADIISQDLTISEAVSKMTNRPLLVIENERLLGIIAAYDLL